MSIDYEGIDRLVIKPQKYREERRYLLKPGQQFPYYEIKVLTSPSFHCSLPFEEYHGTENRFIIFDTTTTTIPDQRKLTINMCTRSGVDGVLYLSLDQNYQIPTVDFTLIQPDGSTAAMCGNGARCAAKWAADRTNTDSIIIDTPAGQRRAEINNSSVRIDMGSPSFAPSDIGLNRDRSLINEDLHGFPVTAVDTGVPHTVIFVENVDSVSIEDEAPPIRHADIFQKGSNVTFAAVQNESFDQRTFERGVEDETSACGTGAVAIAMVARQRGLVETNEPIAVFPPGGKLIVTVRSDGTALLEGPARKSNEGRVI